MNISQHAKEQYCLRKYNDQFYYISRSITEELNNKLDKAKPSKYHPREFFNGRFGFKAKNVTLFQDDDFIYAVRDNTLVTILSVPGKDPISDFIRNH